MDFERIFMPFSNWKVVLLSFLGATTFWFFSALGKEYNTRINYPIEVIFDQDSLISMQPIAASVEIDVTGGGWNLFRQSFWFGSDPIKIEPDNPASIKFLTRPTILPIVQNHLNQFQIQINFLYTDTLFIDIDRKISKLVNLEVDSTSISLDKNYRIVSPIRIEPDTARIYGPVRYIDTLESTCFIPVESQEIDRNFDRFVTLGLQEGYSISSDPGTVNVKFEVERFDNLQMPVKLELMNFPEDSSIWPTREEVIVNFIMQRSLREDLFDGDFKVMLDFDMINRADSTAPAIIMIYPENALEVEVVPDTVKIRYRE
ncbi:MAG: hypothetical protein RIM99_01025 [Cyclobacteriaceae bacterium]